MKAKSSQTWAAGNSKRRAMSGASGGVVGDDDRRSVRFEECRDALLRRESHGLHDGREGILAHDDAADRETTPSNRS